MTQTSTVPPSSTIAKWEWLGNVIPHPIEPIKGDTYPITWADDDNLYTSAGDPLWGANFEPQPALNQMSGLDVEVIRGRPPSYQVEKVNEMLNFVDWGGKGPKPSGMICINGVLYLAAQNMLGFKPPAHGKDCQHGSDATIFMSRDHGRTWMSNSEDITAPMFPGCKFGGPAFVQYGKNAENVKDGFVYAISGDQWDNGADLRVGRVPFDRIMDAPAWEFVGSVDSSNKASWTKSMDDAAVVFSDDRHLSLPEMVYIKGLNRYLMLTWNLFDDFKHNGSALAIYESPEPWGPFSIVHREEIWETIEYTAYCPRIPLKWFDHETLTGWLLFSGSWRPQSPIYRSNVRQFKLTRKT